MSQRRQPGEIVKRVPGSGFLGSAEPLFVQVPEKPAYDDCVYWDSEAKTWRVNEDGEAEHCMLGCGDENCREWANLKVVHGPSAGQFLYHISECQMESLNDADTALLKSI